MGTVPVYRSKSISADSSPTMDRFLTYEAEARLMPSKTGRGS